MTKVEGINYCVRCLAELAELSSSGPQAEAPVSSRWAALSVAGWLLLLLPLYWLMVEVAMPGGG